jgi:hypothetical protein
MVTPRLDGPFAATRQYGAQPLPLAFDVLTLPFQISNTLTGVPPLEIPVFGQGALAPAPMPPPTPAPVGRFSSYRAQIAAATSRAALDVVRDAFYSDYAAGLLTLVEYQLLNDAYVAQYAVLPAPAPPPSPAPPPAPAPPPSGTVSSYRAQIAAATSRAALDVVRDAFYSDYAAGRLNLVEYQLLNDAYVAQYAILPVTLVPGLVPADIALAPLIATGDLLIVTAFNPITSIYEAFVPNLPGNSLREIRPNSTLIINMRGAYTVTSSGVSFTIPANIATQVAVGAVVFFTVTPTPTQPVFGTVSSYRAQIAAATSRAALDVVRDAFYNDYAAGRLTFAEYQLLYDAYVAQYAILPVPAPRPTPTPTPILTPTPGLYQIGELLTATFTLDGLCGPVTAYLGLDSLNRHWYSVHMPDGTDRTAPQEYWARC